MRTGNIPALFCHRISQNLKQNLPHSRHSNFCWTINEHGRKPGKVTPKFRPNPSSTVHWQSILHQSVRSVTQSCPTLRPHESQHARPPCPSPTPGVHSDSRPSGQWCHPAISSSVVPFFSCPQYLTASKSFPMSQLFAWGAQSTSIRLPILSSFYHLWNRRTQTQPSFV